MERRESLQGGVVMALWNWLLGAPGSEVSEDEAESVDIDGDNDFLSLSSDFVGNTDSKTFTFSCWVYFTKDLDFYIYQAANGFFEIDYDNAVKNIRVKGYNSSGTKILDGQTNNIPTNTFLNILVSCDMSDSNKRHIYINDSLDTTTWSTYSNFEIDFTRLTHSIGAGATGTKKLNGRPSNVFLAYEYVDLSIESNRRIFITPDLKPA